MTDQTRTDQAPRVWDSTYARLVARLDAARERHNRLPWNVDAWSDHIAARDAFRAYEDSCYR